MAAPRSLVLCCCEYATGEPLGSKSCKRELRWSSDPLEPGGGELSRGAPLGADDAGGPFARVLPPPGADAGPGEPATLLAPLPPFGTLASGALVASAPGREVAGAALGAVRALGAVVGPALGAGAALARAVAATVGAALGAT